MTRGATFPEPRRRWPHGPGRGCIASREGAPLPEQSCGAGTARGAAGALARRGPADRTCAASSPTESAGPRCPAASRQPEGRRHASERSCAPPSSASGALLQQRGRPAVGGGGGADGASHSSLKLWSRLASEAGSGQPQPAAGFLPPRGEEEPAAPEADWGTTGSGAHLLSGHFCRRKTSVGQTWCLRACSRFALGRFCFGRNYWAGRLHKSEAF